MTKRKKRRSPLVVRVPNPDAPDKERLDTPPHRVHQSDKAYRRRPKHPKREVE